MQSDRRDLQIVRTDDLACQLEFATELATPVGAQLVERQTDVGCQELVQLAVFALGVDSAPYRSS
jgi:hypothetical protein